mmetsp:Transcript_52943/g.123240  ORF Transcript_52943/g.123240 Transcript_52943/m.123240 type:complete len:203 (-) Transcript_52943:280-888(-)
MPILPAQLRETRAGRTMSSPKTQPDSSSSTTTCDMRSVSGTSPTARWSDPLYGLPSASTRISPRLRSFASNFRAAEKITLLATESSSMSASARSSSSSTSSNSRTTATLASISARPLVFCSCRYLASSSPMRSVSLASETSCSVVVNGTRGDGSMVSAELREGSRAVKRVVSLELAMEAAGGATSTTAAVAMRWAATLGAAL